MSNLKIKNENRIGFSETPDKEIMDFLSVYGAGHYERFKLVVREAKGAWLTDIRGDKFLDCLAAYSAANQGHHHPRIVRAVVDALQGNYGSVLSNIVYTDIHSHFARKLSTIVPQLGVRFGTDGNKMLPKNGGVESVETAIKMMRYYGWKSKGIEDGRQEIIVFNNNFHGRMITEVSFSSSKKYREGFGPLTPGFVSLEYGDLEAVKSAINDNTCGILVEPLQGEGGMYVPPDGFLRGLRELSDEHEIFLTFDEIQVGLGRTGKMFCFQHENVVPDGLILGKAISGGLVPVSVFVTNSKMMDLAFKPGSEGSTYGGYPLACAAGIAALDVIVEENLADKAAEKGKILKNRIEKIAARSSHVKEVRGKGLFIGIEVNDGDAIKYCRRLLEAGVLANDSHGHTIRISPPLIITDDEIEYLLERLEAVLVG